MTRQIQFYDYVFPSPQSISDNFLDFVPSTERIMGMDGGFDNYGDDTAPQQIGNVAISYILSTDSPTTMQTMIDSFSKLASYGRQELRKWPDGASDTQFRFCNAKFNNVSVSEDMAEGVDFYHRRLTVNFQVDDPMWYRRLSNAAEWATSGGADNLVWDSPTQCWDGRASLTSISGYLSTLNPTYSGQAPTPMIAVLSTTGGQTMCHPRIQVWFENKMHSEVGWNDCISAGEKLVIDSRRKQIWLLSTTRPPNQSYDQFWTTYRHWLKMMPQRSGGNEIRVYCESGSAGQIDVTWLEAFYT
jgi:hypothetical protein